MTKMSLTFIIAALKAEKFQKPKCVLFFETPCSKVWIYVDDHPGTSLKLTYKVTWMVIVLTWVTVNDTLQIDKNYSPLTLYR